MHKIALFAEDFAHEQIIGSIVKRKADERGVDIDLDWRNARGGYGKVVQELKEYLRDLKEENAIFPDLIVVATDANCKGFNERRKEFRGLGEPTRMILAIPDPHVERWLLLDGAAFKAVFGKGCSAPDHKCDRNRYKIRLIDAIYHAGVTPNIGGIEFADEIIGQMDFARAAAQDRSFKRFIEDLQSVFTKG